MKTNKIYDFKVEVFDNLDLPEFTRKFGTPIGVIPNEFPAYIEFHFDADMFIARVEVEPFQVGDNIVWCKPSILLQAKAFLQYARKPEDVIECAGHREAFTIVLVENDADCMKQIRSYAQTVAVLDKRE